MRISEFQARKGPVRKSTAKGPNSNDEGQFLRYEDFSLPERAGQKDSTAVDHSPER